MHLYFNIIVPHDQQPFNSQPHPIPQADDKIMWSTPTWKQSQRSNKALWIIPHNVPDVMGVDYFIVKLPFVKLYNFIPQPAISESI